MTERSPFSSDINEYKRLKLARADRRKIKEGKVYNTLFLAQAEDMYFETRLLVVKRAILSSGLIGFSVQREGSPEDTADFSFDTSNMWKVETYTDPTGFTIADIHMGEGFFLPNRDQSSRRRGASLTAVRSLGKKTRTSVLEEV